MTNKIEKIIEGNQQLKEMFLIKEEEYDNNCDYFQGGPQLNYIDEIELDLVFYLVDNNLNLNQINLSDWLFNYLN
jgi:hypothetical protein